MFNNRFQKFLSVLWLLALAAVLLSPSTLLAQKAKEGKDTLDDLSFRNPLMWTTSQGEPLNAVRGFVPTAALSDFERFNAAAGGHWTMIFDRITGKPHTLEGGTPWIPGSGMGNTLTAEDLGVTRAQAGSNSIPANIVVGKAYDFLKIYPNLFGVDPADLRLREGVTGPMLDYLYFVDFSWTYKGILVENAHLGFYLNSGNLVMVGQEFISDSIEELDASPAFTRDVAWEILWGYLGKPLESDRILDAGRLVIVPTAVPDLIEGTPIKVGRGFRYRLAYVLSFRRAGVLGTWEARIDAHTGEILSFADENKYGHIQGGVFKTDKNPTQAEVTMPLPYADYGATSFADVAGNFTGTSGTGTMTGRTGSAGNVGAVDIVDSCGAISLISDGTGLISFGSSGGTDCTTPGVGGAGNTHSARTQYWNVAQIKIKAYTYLSGNATAATWLQARLTDNVNINDDCNAYWSSPSVNFFRSSTNCGNTGELPGVSLHEWAHGMDTNDGNGFSPDSGTGEVYGDTAAMLQTHQSCMGGGFWLAYNTGCGAPPSQGSSFHNCTGYGNCCLDCSGVREADYAKHTSPTPATPLNFNQSCPTSTCKGPCGKECHCENAPGIQANWDLVVRFLTAAPYSMDLNTAWMLLDKLWYASSPTRTAAFVCGANTSTAVGNLFNQYRLVDDCDGNLTNGTPHAAAIWSALGVNHGIGNSAAVNTDNDCGCADLGTPVLSGAAGNGSVSLSWSAIAGAGSYDVYRNETSCSSGYTKVGTTTSTAFTDTPLSNGVTYYYVIQAINGTTPACPPSAMSNCVALTPAVSTCTAPGAPTLSSATGACTGVNLAWSAGSGTTLAYNIYRVAGACGGTYAKIAGPVTGTTYADTTAVAGTQYAYVVRGACDAGGTTESANSNCLTGTRLAAPGTPTAVTASTTRCTDVQVAWNAVSGATSYNVLRGTTCGTALNTFTGVTSPYNDASAVVGTSYQYWVVAINTCGTSANSACAAGVRLGVPGAPGGPTYTNVSCNTLTVNWVAVSGATAYDLYRRTGACGAGSAIAPDLAGTTFNDSGLTASTQYSYYLVAKNTCGSSASGTCTSITTTGVPSAPAAPAVTDGCTGLAISWTAVSGATSYNIYRRTGGCGTTSWSSVQAGVTGTAWTDTTVALGTTYGYYIEAVNACGTATDGNTTCTAGTHSLQAPAAPGSVTATGACAEVTVTWGPVSGATSYNVLRGTVCGTVVTTFTGVTSAYHDTSAVAGTTYQYWVVAVNGCGNSPNSSCASAARLVSPTPTISGAGANACPSASVVLTTESGQNSYLWYRGGSPISGANAYQYTATQSGDYTVSYANAGGCTGTSAAKTVTITACAPNIVYQSRANFTQVTGDGDANFDPGEKWSVEVTLANAGTANATNVTASLSDGANISVCNNPGAFGSIAMGGTATYTYAFVISPTFAPCGGPIGFDIASKTSAELTPAGADQLDVFSVSVGKSGGGSTTVDEAGTTGSITAKTTVYFYTVHNPVTAVPGVLTACTVDIAMTPPGNSSSSLTVAVEHDPGNDATYEYTQTVYSGTKAGWVNVSGFNLSTMVDGSDTGNGAWRVRVTSSGTGGGSSTAGTMTSWTLHLTTDGGGWDCTYVGTGACATVNPKEASPTGSPMTAIRSGSGTSVDVTYTAGCGTTDHVVYWGGGPISTTLDWTHAACNRGVTGNLSFDPGDPASGNFFYFVIVGQNATKEGSFGTDSLGTERPEADDGAWTCNKPRDLTGTCP